MIVIPAVDVLNGKVVRLLHGDYAAITEYGQDPVAMGSAWVRDGASIVHVVDLEGARSAKPSHDLWRTLGESGIPFQIGGGIRDAALARAAVDAGATRVVVGSAAVHEDGEFARIAASVGRDNVVAAIDVRAGRASTLPSGRPVCQTSSIRPARRGHRSSRP